MQERVQYWQCRWNLLNMMSSYRIQIVRHHSSSQTVWVCVLRKSFATFSGVIGPTLMSRDVMNPVISYLPICFFSENFVALHLCVGFKNKKLIWCCQTHATCLQKGRCSSFSESFIRNQQNFCRKVTPKKIWDSFRRCRYQIKLLQVLEIGWQRTERLVQTFWAFAIPKNLFTLVVFSLLVCLSQFSITSICQVAVNKAAYFVNSVDNAIKLSILQWSLSVDWVYQRVLLPLDTISVFGEHGWVLQTFYLLYRAKLQIWKRNSMGVYVEGTKSIDLVVRGVRWGRGRMGT